MDQKLILEYHKAAKMHMEATYSGNYKKGNKAGDKLKKYNDLMKSDFESYKSEVRELINSENVNVVVWIAGVALGEGFEIKKVENKLKQIAGDKSLGILGFDAKMVLKQYHFL